MRPYAPKKCHKCGGMHDRTESLYDRSEYTLIDRLEQIREKHKIKVTNLTHGEIHSAEIVYLD